MRLHTARTCSSVACELHDDKHGGAPSAAVSCEPRVYGKPMGRRKWVLQFSRGGGRTPMLDLNDKRWAEMKGGYRAPFDPRPLLAQIETGKKLDETWYELTGELFHQGDVGEASYAAVPHLVRIHGHAACQMPIPIRSLRRSIWRGEKGRILKCLGGSSLDTTMQSRHLQ